MQRLLFLSTMITWSIIAVAGHGDYGRWYSHTNGIETVIFGLIAILIIIATIYALIQKIKTDKGWQTGGCLVVVVIAIIIFVAFMSNMEKSRHKESPPTRYTPSIPNSSNAPIKESAPTTTTSSSISPSQTVKQSVKCSYCTNGFITESKEKVVEEVCPDCKGKTNTKTRVCIFCKGEGKIYNDMKRAYDKCLDCNGTGQQTERTNCNTCFNTGEVRVKKTITEQRKCSYCNGTGYRN